MWIPVGQSRAWETDECQESSDNSLVDLDEEVPSPRWRSLPVRTAVGARREYLLRLLVAWPWRLDITCGQHQAVDAHVRALEASERSYINDRGWRHRVRRLRPKTERGDSRRRTAERVAICDQRSKGACRGEPADYDEVAGPGVDDCESSAGQRAASHVGVPVHGVGAVLPQHRGGRAGAKGVDGLAL